MRNLVSLLVKTLVDPETSLKEASHSEKSSLLKVLLVLLVVVVIVVGAAIVGLDFGDD